jgi:hypothetical protein
MSYRFARLLAAGLLLGWAGTGFTADVMIEVELQNNTKPRKAATDLHVKFTMPVPVASKPSATDEHSTPNVTTGSVEPSAPGSTTGTAADFTFAGGQDIPAGASVVLKFEGPAGATIDKDKSYWTTPAAQPGSVASMGQAPNIIFNHSPTGQYFAFATFYNPEPVPVIYGNIQFYTNNDMANYNLNSFDTPTGQLVQGLPPQITLNPGQTSPMLPLGPINPLRYVLGLAQAAPVNDGDDQYALGTASAPQVPVQTRPILVTGYNADVIADRDQSARFAQPFDANTFAWFESGAIDVDGVQHNNGLPAGLPFMSLTGSMAIYQIQPANGDNVLQLGPGQTGTLRLITPQPYIVLSIIASGGTSAPFSTGAGDINFADGTTQLFHFDTFDWCNGGGGLHPQAVLPWPTGHADVGPYGTAFVYHRECDFQVYETVIPIDPWHAGVPILSIDFTGAPDAFYSNIFGVSGQ